MPCSFRCQIMLCEDRICRFSNRPSDSIFSVFSQNSPKTGLGGVRKRAENRRKRAFFGVSEGVKIKKMNFFLADYQQVDKKSNFFWMEAVQRIAKNAIFAVPIERETEMRGIGESALKEWKDVANTQGKFLWRFASDEVGTDKKEKDIK